MKKNYFKMKNLKEKSLKLTRPFDKNVCFFCLQFKDIYAAEKFFRCQRDEQKSQEKKVEYDTVRALFEVAAKFGAILSKITYMKESLVIRLDFYDKRERNAFKRNIDDILKSSIKRNRNR